jgi:hypothetical protein
VIILSAFGSLNPKYWYTDEKGDIQKYVYCKLCHAGPYKITENKDRFLFFGMGNKDPYCVSCSHHNFQTSLIPREKPSQQEKIEGLPLNPFKEEPLTMVDLN